MCKYQPIHCILCGIFMNDYQLYGRECPYKGDPRRCQPRMVDVWALKGKCGGDFCENPLEGEMDEDEYGFDREKECGNRDGDGLAEEKGDAGDDVDIRAGGEDTHGRWDVEIEGAVLVDSGDMGVAQETQVYGVEGARFMSGEDHSSGNRSGNRDGTVDVNSVEMETSIDVMMRDIIP